MYVGLKTNHIHTLLGTYYVHGHLAFVHVCALILFELHGYCAKCRLLAENFRLFVCRGAVERSPASL